MKISTVVATLLASALLMMACKDAASTHTANDDPGMPGAAPATGHDHAASAHAPGGAPAGGAVPMPAAAGCAGLVGANPVQTEMRQLECAMQRAVAAIGRDELAMIASDLHVVHAAKEATAAAIARGDWKPATGEVAAFIALDEVFHESLGALVVAAQAGDAVATPAALGAVLGGCQGCHAAFRPVAPAH